MKTTVKSSRGENGAEMMLMLMRRSVDAPTSGAFHATDETLKAGDAAVAVSGAIINSVVVETASREFAVCQSGSPSATIIHNRR